MHMCEIHTRETPAAPVETVIQNNKRTPYALVGRVNEAGFCLDLRCMSGSLVCAIFLVSVNASGVR